MRKLTLIIFTGLFFLVIQTPRLFAQQHKANVEIEVLEGRFIRGTGCFAEVNIEDIKIDFTASSVTIVIPHEDKSIVLDMVNTDCKAYCDKAKRVRQLRKGDDTMLRNIILKEKSNILRQLKQGGFEF